MDPNFGWRGDLRCHLCKTTFPYMYCNICYLQLCNAYVWEHISDDLQVKKNPHKCVIQRARIHRQRTDLPTVGFLKATSIAKDNNGISSSNRTFINTYHIKYKH